MGCLALGVTSIGLARSEINHAIMVQSICDYHECRPFIPFHIQIRNRIYAFIYQHSIHDN